MTLIMQGTPWSRHLLSDHAASAKALNPNPSLIVIIVVFNDDPAAITKALSPNPNPGQTVTNS